MSTTPNPRSSDILRRRTAVTEEKGKAPAHEHDHEHDDAGHSHSHSHSHSVFGGHSHGADDGHDGAAEEVLKALKGQGDRGSQITLIGLFSNVGLTASKGLAGWYMNSASLLADAGHSFSDLVGDFVTLFCWKLSRKPPSERYPYGFAKFETLGTTTVSLLLLGGALGIGFHSYQLLAQALLEVPAQLPPGALQTAVQNVTEAVQLPPSLAEHIGHGHGHGDLDPNAAWFAAVSVLAKEWLYRITKKVADEEGSPVLLANAVHHRSDMWSSLVALIAIGGTVFFPAIPLDPIGGFLVSILILKSGIDIMSGSFGELTDAGLSSRTKRVMTQALEPLIVDESVRSISDLRGRRAGALTFVDLTATVPGSLSVAASSALEERITRALKEARKEVAEVRVRFRPVDDEKEQ